MSVRMVLEPPPPASQAQVTTVRAGEVRSGVMDWLAEEVPVAFEVNGLSHAIMLASPTDLEDYALGFALTEGLIDRADDLLDIEVEPAEIGITLQLRVTLRCFMRMKERRRVLAGRTGCGLCGKDSLKEAVQAPKPLMASAGLDDGANLCLSKTALQKAQTELLARQRLQHQTGAVHAAAWCDGDGAVQLVREDVGRHNALDKVIGARASGLADDEASMAGFMLITSRASFEMVHKAVTARVPVLAAMSAPTALAVRMADQAGLTLLGFVRSGDMVVYTHAHRIDMGCKHHGAGKDSTWT
ncbi:formate dehydrogenase accessory sulfurtransferase FdhD [Leptothrix ochracea]|uniref:formate dehydrogenase accessory sulfurtransferase FdhD n=1 Tax=Leptothrix ochracea TaxID=735331 RepID=UPI0034E29786